MAKFFDRGSDHKWAQKEGKMRDGYTCMICGKYCKDAQGHHVIKVSEGGPATTQNIITLCPQCHREYHSGELKVDIGMF